MDSAPVLRLERSFDVPGCPPPQIPLRWCLLYKALLAREIKSSLPPCMLEASLCDHGLLVRVAPLRPLLERGSRTGVAL